MFEPGIQVRLHQNGHQYACQDRNTHNQACFGNKLPKQLSSGAAERLAYAHFTPTGEGLRGGHVHKIETSSKNQKQTDHAQGPKEFFVDAKTIRFVEMQSEHGLGLVIEQVFDLRVRMVFAETCHHWVHFGKGMPLFQQDKTKGTSTCTAPGLQASAAGNGIIF